MLSPCNCRAGWIPPGKLRRLGPIENRPPRLDKSRPSEVGLEAEEKPHNYHPFIRRPGGDCPVLHRRWPIYLRRRGDRRSLAAPPGAGRASQAGQPPPRHRHRHRAGRPRRADPIRSARHPGTHPFPSGSDRGAILMAEVRRTPQAETDLAEILEYLHQHNPSVCCRALCHCVLR